LRRRDFLTLLAATGANARIVSAVLLVSIATLSFVYQVKSQSSSRSRHRRSRSDGQTITSIPFGEMNGTDVYNASGVVPLADSRFLFCDNNSNDVLFELDLTAYGQKKSPLIRRPLQGLPAGAIDDLEAMMLAESGSHRFIFVASSLSVKKSKDGNSQKILPSGLLRVRVNPDDSMSAENLPGFRDWFVEHEPAIAASATLIPDEGGLNIEGLAWDHHHHTLLFGLRTPLSIGKPLVIPVRIKHLDGPWSTSNLEMLPPIRLLIDASEGEQGIRSIEYIPSRHSFLVVVGRPISGAKVPFRLYEWNGNRQGKVQRLNVSFADKFKPEGVTSGTISGKPVLLFVDDAGGYQVLWLDRISF
jgi:hypothetical protein